MQVLAQTRAFVNLATAGVLWLLASALDSVLHELVFEMRTAIFASTLFEPSEIITTASSCEVFKHGIWLQENV